MAIDRIGKGAGLPGGLPSDPDVKPAGGASSAERAERAHAFKVERPESANAAQSANAAGNVESAAAPLARLRAGEVDVHGYIDLKVDEATSALKGLSSAELDEIKSVLRDQMKSDPGLSDLVHMATGKMPTPPED